MTEVSWLFLWYRGVPFKVTRTLPFPMMMTEPEGVMVGVDVVEMALLAGQY